MVVIHVYMHRLGIWCSDPIAGYTVLGLEDALPSGRLQTHLPSISCQAQSLCPQH